MAIENPNGQAGGNAGVDSGLSAEEQAAFDQMRASSGESGGVDQGGADQQQAGGAPPQVQQQSDAAAQAGADDDEGDDGDDAGASAEQQAQPDGQKPPPRRVSFGKFQRVENRAKQAERTLEELRAKMAESDVSRARMEERFNMLVQALNGGQPQQSTNDDPEPDPEQDIFAHNAWLKRQLGKVTSTLDELRQGRQAESEQQHVFSNYQADAQHFASKEPSFPAAYQYLMASRAIELAQMEFGVDLTDQNARMTPQQIMQLRDRIAEEERYVAETALQAGRSPAAAIFALAKGRGFRPETTQPPQVQPQGQNGGAPNGTGGAPVGSPQQQRGQGGVGAEIERIRQGAHAGMSLSNGNGAPNQPMSLERLVNMGDDEFSAMLDSMTPNQLRQIAGG